MSNRVKQKKKTNGGWNEKEEVEVKEDTKRME